MIANYCFDARLVLDDDCEPRRPSLPPATPPAAHAAAGEEIDGSASKHKEKFLKSTRRLMVEKDYTWGELREIMDRQYHRPKPPPVDCRLGCERMGVMKNRTRHKLIVELSRKSCTIAELAVAAGKNAQQLQYFLRSLRNCGVVATSRKAKHTVYCLTPVGEQVVEASFALSR